MIKKKFLNGPFGTNYVVNNKPLHYGPLKEEQKTDKKIIPWKNFLPKSNDVFRLDSFYFYGRLI
jgi:hypothetical protein